MNRWYAIALALAALAGGGKAWLDYAVDQKVHEELARQLPQVRAGSANLRPDGSLRLSGVLLPDGLQINEVLIPQAYRLRNGLPTQIRLRGLSYALNNSGGNPPALLKALGYADYYLSGKELQALGYNPLQTDAVLHASHDPDSQMLNLRAELGGNLGQIELELQFSQVTEFSPQTLKNLANLPLSRAKLDWHNTELLERLSAYLGKRQQLDATALRENLAKRVSADLRRIGFDPASLDALQNSISTPAPLHLRLEPPQPLPLRGLSRYDPIQLPSVLGLRADSGTVAE